MKKFKSEQITFMKFRIKFFAVKSTNITIESEYFKIFGNISKEYRL